MKKNIKKNHAGFSLLELIFSMTITLVLMTLAGMIFSQSISTRERETRRTEAIVAVQSALNLISREVANSGYGLADKGLPDNGIVIADSGRQKLRFRSNIHNENGATDQLGEDLTYFLEPTSNTIVRYDPAVSPSTSTVIDRISDLSFQYYNYSGFAAAPTESDTPSADTARVRISVTVQLTPVQGQMNTQSITYTSDVALRNSKYISKQY